MENSDVQMDNQTADFDHPQSFGSSEKDKVMNLPHYVHNVTERANTNNQERKSFNFD